MNATTQLGWWFIENRIDASILSGFPKRMNELPPHVVTRLARNGMIRKHERIHIDRGWRWLWVAGPNLPLLLRWVKKHETSNLQSR